VLSDIYTNIDTLVCFNARSFPLPSLCQFQLVLHSRALVSTSISSPVLSAVLSRGASVMPISVEDVILVREGYCRGPMIGTVIKIKQVRVMRQKRRRTFSAPCLLPGRSSISLLSMSLPVVAAGTYIGNGMICRVLRCTLSCLQQACPVW
jgi:hypothetical protein